MKLFNLKSILTLSIVAASLNAMAIVRKSGEFVPSFCGENQSLNTAIQKNEILSVCLGRIVGQLGKMALQITYKDTTDDEIKNEKLIVIKEVPTLGGINPQASAMKITVINGKPTQDESELSKFKSKATVLTVRKMNGEFRSIEGKTPGKLNITAGNFAPVVVTQ
jgi:hypothetical protein